MSFLNVQTALDSRLDSVPGLDLPVAWELTNYQITKGQTFVRPTNLRAISDQQNLENSLQSNTGIYQVDIFYPMDGKGAGALLDLVNKVYDHFKEQLTLNSSGTEVYIRNISLLTLDNSENSWMIGGIQINYDSYF